MTATLLLTGSQGQLGTTIQQYWPGSALSEQYQRQCVDVNDLDLTNHPALTDYLDQLEPVVIVNAAAYTAVDRAEEEQGSAFRVNEQVVADLASWCKSSSAALYHISTDFVFDGKADSPYATDSATNPVSVYGASKLAGEQQLQALLPDSSTIVRTSWLYSEYGNNFVKTMLRLMGEKDSLGIVADQIGSPTSTHSLVNILFRCIESRAFGIFHWSDGDEISWYDFAAAIQQAGIEFGLLEEAIPLNRLTTAEYPTPAARPAYSVLDRSKTIALLDETPNSWREELFRVVATLAQLEGDPE
ncbi:MAG: dTDP-4-dehydrorhamnose reductase [Pseudomonadales bacterium]|nr:dTDP-4-dehydrorhamnose reductase [Pseudomonadales bacterium]